MQLSGNIKTYWLLLKDLDKESKLSLIELLIQSLKKTSVDTNNTKLPNDKNWVDDFNGCWNFSDETAEDIINHIEKSRSIGRQIEMLKSSPKPYSA